MNLSLADCPLTLALPLGGGENGPRPTEWVQGRNAGSTGSGNSHLGPLPAGEGGARAGFQPFQERTFRRPTGEHSHSPLPERCRTILTRRPQRPQRQAFKWPFKTGFLSHYSVKGSKGGKLDFLGGLSALRVRLFCCDSFVHRRKRRERSRSRAQGRRCN